MRHSITSACLFGMIVTSAATLIGADEAADSKTPARPVDFAREVQPILARRCFHCHGSDKAEAGLKLNSHAGITAKLESGEHAVVANKPEASALLARVLSRDEDERMPPEGKPLTAEQIDVLRRWIASGAEWKEPETKSVADWPFSPPADIKPPQVQHADRVNNGIDQFILARLEQKGLTLAPQASSRTLVRRLYFDLIGLPPSPAEVDAFVNDADPQAYEKLVEKLLADSRYGERWARFWLDLARYADTAGYEGDPEMPNAWRYRDYVIDAFNLDKPYDKFVIDQIAGDCGG